MQQQLAIKFNRSGIMFFILLEGLTVPLVAMSNSIAIKNWWYMCLMGFAVAFSVVLLLARMLKGWLIKHSSKLFGVNFTEVRGLWYCGVLAGILEMVMFMVQDILFSQHWNDFSAGFMSAVLSVGATLLLYELVVSVTDFSIKFYQQQQCYQLRFRLRDIALLALFFGGYEFWVCPITGWWIPYHEYARLLVALASGIIGGASGGIFLYCLVRYLPVKAQLTLAPL